MDDHRGWYEGRNLPHYDVGDITQFVTFRLGDSLPKEALERLEEELKGIKQIEMLSELLESRSSLIKAQVRAFCKRQIAQIS